MNGGIVCWTSCGEHQRVKPKAIELESVAGAYWREMKPKLNFSAFMLLLGKSPEQLSEYKRRKKRHCGEITEGWAKNWGCSF